MSCETLSSRGISVDGTLRHCIYAFLSFHCFAVMFVGLLGSMILYNIWSSRARGLVLQGDIIDNKS